MLHRYIKHGRTKKAWKCKHPDRVLYAKGMCKSCYLKYNIEVNILNTLVAQEGAIRKRAVRNRVGGQSAQARPQILKAINKIINSKKSCNDLINAFGSADCRSLLYSSSNCLAYGSHRPSSSSQRPMPLSHPTFVIIAAEVLLPSTCPGDTSLKVIQEYYRSGDPP